ncbi:nitrate reductase molybdenum cofactor assembly chaperone [Companilactobacillus allii]|uniref:Nitrate reductase molybdenum cofactor assembly chaperone n=1 Tax=Companilactobacillus allii TaxID=1847728 RepID=A0A1P8Q481_9LACO|nr:nitrate reductase molybdenum cofactor assembly chaperone [Companilactobacillus allii]APX72668.1 nitrate reductase molybdenum cofactor assembly chaperone [Companilactobacillus allii]USQ69772.1 nitrate reductase molybdenum cofactor assembly chaperone [Companilactobacillus allii]
MINIEKLNTLKQGFTYLSRLLDYPEQDILDPDFLDKFQKEYAKTPSKSEITEVILEMQTYSLEELKTHYVSLFELNNRYTLYMTYYKMTDSRERGQLLAKLKMLYEMFGVRIDGTELSDYLPLMLEFLAYSDWKDDERQQDMQLMVSVIEDGTYSLLKNAEVQDDDMYFKLIRIVRAEFKSCIEQTTKEGEKLV